MLACRVPGADGLATHFVVLEQEQAPLDEWIGLDSLGPKLDWAGYLENAFGLDRRDALLNVDLFWIGFNGRGS